MNARSEVKKETGIVDIRGKQYQTVAYRVGKFRETHPDWSLLTEVVERDVDCVVVRATIANEDGRVLATGHAEEYRKASQINRTSALENAETSAVGRALAALGFGGTEFATANEVVNAIHQQNNPPDASDAHLEPLSISEAQRDEILKLAPLTGRDAETICAACKVDNLMQLSEAKAEKVLARLREEIEAAKERA